MNVRFKFWVYYKWDKNFYFILFNVVWCAKKGSGYFLNHAYGDDYFSTVLIMRIVTVFLELESLFVFHWQYRFLSPHSSISCFFSTLFPHSTVSFCNCLTLLLISFISPQVLLFTSFPLFIFFFFSVLASPLSLFSRLDHVNMLAGKKKWWQTPKK